MATDEAGIVYVCISEIQSKWKFRIRNFNCDKMQELKLD